MAETLAKDTRARIKSLEKQVDQLTSQLQDCRRAKFSIPKAGGKVGRPNKSYCRVVVPDSHGSYLDGPAARAFLNDLEQINPAEIVMLGDHLDCGGFLAQHHTLGYIAQGEYTFEHDVAAANKFLDEIQERAPHATIH